MIKKFTIPCEFQEAAMSLALDGLNRLNRSKIGKAYRHQLRLIDIRMNRDGGRVLIELEFLKRAKTGHHLPVSKVVNGYRFNVSGSFQLFPDHDFRKMAKQLRQMERNTG